MTAHTSFDHVPYMVRHVPFPMTTKVRDGVLKPCV